EGLVEAVQVAADRRRAEAVDDRDRLPGARDPGRVERGQVVGRLHLRGRVAVDPERREATRGRERGVDGARAGRLRDAGTGRGRRGALRGRGAGKGGEARGKEGEREGAACAVRHPPTRVPAIRLSRNREP